MYKEVLRSIDNIGVFPIISFVIFFVIFILMLLWVLKFNKHYINEMANIPFKSDNNSDKQKNINHETTIQ